MKNLIIVSGNKQNGKDTVANYLCKSYEYRKYAFADKIKQVANVLFGWDGKYLDGELKECIDDMYGLSPREFLQDLGTEYMQFHLNKKFPEFSKRMGRCFWVHSTKLDIIKSFYDSVVISDCRFLHEQEYIEKFYPFKKLLFLKVQRDVEDNNYSNHASETEVCNLKYDYLIDNNDTYEVLFNTIDEIIKKEGMQ